MWKSSERRRSFGQSMINRSDSEKLSDVNLIFKPEVHLQSLFSEENVSIKNADANSSSQEYFDVPQSPYWTPTREEAPPSTTIQSYSRRRTSVIAACSDSDRTGGILMATFRRESRVDSSIEDKEERTLEVLREIVRKCTNPVAMLRPTAGQVMNIFAVHDK